MTIPCDVEMYYGSWLVTFPGRHGSLLLQSDWDQHGFAVSCGLADYNKTPSNDSRFLSLDPYTISECPEEYYDLAE